MPISRVFPRLAPLSVPMNRRLQTLATLYFSFSFFFFGATSLVLCLCAIFNDDYRLRVCVCLYFFYYVWDMNKCIRGGRRSTWVREWTVWKYFRDFFPIALHKEAAIEPDANYIFGYHPHGITSAGAFCNFATEATGFSKMFPGIVPHLLVLEGQFYFPFHRELILLCGINSVSRESLNHILTRKGKGNAAIIVVGGANEALEAVPNSYRLNLNRRLGFIRVAIQNGSSLVPVFSFGENDIFHQERKEPHSILRILQTKFTKIFGFSLPLFYGRGIFQYSFGILPYRKPINTVIGSPIPVVKDADPSEEKVKAFHLKYVQALKTLFDKHKKSFGADHLELEII